MNQETRRILTAELWRSVAWAGFALVSWAFLVGESARLEATLLNTLGLPFLTWAFLTVGIVGFRLRTDRTLSVRSKEGMSVLVALGVIVAGFGAVFAVTVLGRSLLVVGALYLATAGGTALWLRYTVFRSGRAGIAA
ncbi:MAG: hypothetical protein V5A39_14195 [Haloarculaceae archaeon]